MSLALLPFGAGLALGLLGAALAWWLRPEPRADWQARLFTQLQTPALLLDAQGHVLQANPAFVRDMPLRSKPLQGLPLHQLLSQRQHGPVFDDWWRDVSARPRWQGTVWLRDGRGAARSTWLSLSPLPPMRAGAAAGHVALLSDISGLRMQHEQLRQLAFHDPLTGLPNRRLFARDLARAVERARRHGQGCALMFIDLDHFKLINDGHGHAAGDRVLAETASRLQRLLRAEDAVARLGGDEFTVLLEDVTGPHEAARVARKLLAGLSEPVLVDGRRVPVSASLGIALFPDTATDATSLMHAADAAMYRAKCQGRGSFAYSGDAHASADTEHAEGPAQAA